MVLAIEGSDIAAWGSDEVWLRKVFFELSNVNFVYRTIGDGFGGQFRYIQIKCGGHWKVVTQDLCGLYIYIVVAILRRYK